MPDLGTKRDSGGYRIAGSGEDWDMFLRMGEASKLANLGEVLHLYRVHPGSVTTKYVGLVRARIAHACCCAKQRAGGSPEVTFDEFVAKERARAPWQRAAERMDSVRVGSVSCGLGADSRLEDGQRICPLGLGQRCVPLQELADGLSRIAAAGRPAMARFACAATFG